MSHEVLGKYSTERFYTLSEIQTHAPTAIFLQDLVAEDHRSSKQETQQPPNDAATPDFPRYSILYVLWRPDMTDNAEEFVDTVLRMSIKTIQRHVVISPSTDGVIPASPAEDRSRAWSGYSKNEERRRDFRFNDSPSSTSFGQSSDEKEDQSQSNKTISEVILEGSLSAPNSPQQEDECEGATTLYIVVERVSTPPETSTSSLESLHQAQEALAEQVVRYAAIRLRDLCEGISVYCANHERAAPGLEACMNAVSLGAADRRRFANSKNEGLVDGLTGPPLDSSSYMGFVLLSAEDLLGFQSQQVTDAAQGVSQSCWCAEWNGRGNLNSYAKRAHEQWRLDRGLPSMAFVGQKKPPVPRRRGRNEFFDEQALDHAIKSFLYDFGVVTIAILYVIFHYGRDIWDALADWTGWG